jgi:hypothetical protein
VIYAAVKARVGYELIGQLMAPSDGASSGPAETKIISRVACRTRILIDSLDCGATSVVSVKFRENCNAIRGLILGTIVWAKQCDAFGCPIEVGIIPCVLKIMKIYVKIKRAKNHSTE